MEITEKFRRGFKQMYDHSFEYRSRLLVTVNQKKESFIEGLRKKEDIKEMEFKRSNRNKLSNDDIVHMLISNGMR